jgi:hypothetical protein
MRETGSTIVAAEDQTVNTNDFKNKILKKEIDNKCRLCQQHEETSIIVILYYTILFYTIVIVV